MSPNTLNRRTVVKGAIWATPAVMFATLVPDVAASTGSLCLATVQVGLSQAQQGMGQVWFPRPATCPEPYRWSAINTTLYTVSAPPGSNSGPIVGTISINTVFDPSWPVGLPLPDIYIESIAPWLDNPVGSVILEGISSTEIRFYIDDIPAGESVSFMLGFRFDTVTGPQIRREALPASRLVNMTTTVTACQPPQEFPVEWFPYP